MRNISIELANFTPVEKRKVEIVERKGLGHPDTLIDGIMEEISKELCREYISTFGKIMHHNVDKGQICGGATNVKFGGGEFTKPIYILLSGRATEEFEGKKVDVTGIATGITKKLMSSHLKNFDLEKDLVIDSKISQGSSDLVELFMRAPKIPLANDTSFAAGYAPLSETELLTLKTENLINSPDYKQKFPALGTDVKVMSMRDGQKITMTICIGFVSTEVTGIDEYVKTIEQVKQDILEEAKKHTQREVEVYINSADDIENESVFLTFTGSSCEMGDDGSVGRGNRVNGLITPSRHMSLEAAAGKNPVSHVGKVYAVAGFEMAKDIKMQYPQIHEANVTLLSRIGSPIDQPKVAAIEIVMDDKEDYEKIKDKAVGIVDAHLENITEITNKIVEGKVTLY